MVEGVKLLSESRGGGGGGGVIVRVVSGGRGDGGAAGARLEAETVGESVRPTLWEEDQ